jgi:general secretion pathway protein B
VQERAAALPPAQVARVTPPRVGPASAPPALPAAPSADLKARAAKLTVQVLSWAPERKDRFVFLNGRKYGEGQMVEDTFLVEQITEDSVVLSARGERVTLKGH